MVVMSFADLIRLFPEQIFEFIEINVRTQDVIESELDVLRRVHVRSAILIDMVAEVTQMDFQIGCCYWLISKGNGRSLHVDSSNSSVPIS